MKNLTILFCFLSVVCLSQNLKLQVDEYIMNQGTKGITNIKIRNAFHATIDSLRKRQADLATSTTNIGVGRTNPVVKFDVNGQIRISGGNPGVGKILQSDGVGIGSWITPFWLSSNGGTLTGTTIVENSNFSVQKKTVNGSNTSILEYRWFIDTNNRLVLRPYSTLNGSTDVFMSEKIAITSVGVGVGGVTPTSNLDIAGQIRIRGGNPFSGGFLKSDADGLSVWAAIGISNITDLQSTLDSKATITQLNGKVGLTGDEVVGGIKTFTDFIIFKNQFALKTTGTNTWGQYRWGLSEDTHNAVLQLYNDRVETVGGSFQTSPVFNINKNGNVMFGSMAESIDKVTVNGSLKVNGYGNFSTDVTFENGGRIESNGNNIYLRSPDYVSSYVNVQSGSTKKIDLLSDGDVIITAGTIMGAPSEKLRASVNGLDSRGYFNFKNISGTSLMFLTNSGNLGIGTINPLAKLEIGGSLSQTSPLLSIRKMGNSLEFGHDNQAGYASTLGANVGNGRPFVCFNCEAGTNLNTYRTRGIIGRVITADLVGGLEINRTTSSFSDNQTLITDVKIDNTGNFGIGENPSYKLSVNGMTKTNDLIVINSNAFAWLYSSGGGVDNKIWRLQSQSDGRFGISRINDAQNIETNYFHIKSNGNIGFGTPSRGFSIQESYMSVGETRSSASTILGNNIVVSNTANSSVSRSVSTSDNGTFLKLNYSTGFTIHTGATGALGADFDENNFERLRLTNSGDMGLGINSPLARFHISGGISMTNGWSRSLQIDSNYPVIVWNSSGAKYAGAGYDHSGKFTFWLNSSTNDVSGGGTIGYTITQAGVLEMPNGTNLQSLTTSQINAIASPTIGRIVYNSTLQKLCFYNGSSWQQVTSSAM